MRTQWPEGVAAARFVGSRDVEVSYPCLGCADPNHLAIRFLDEPNDSPAPFKHTFPRYGADPWELHEPSPLALELMHMVLGKL